MAATIFRLSAFGDEIADDLDEQLRVLTGLGIRHLELRGAWGTNVLHMGEDMVGRVRQLCQRQGVAVSCIGSPVGKSPLAGPLAQEVANLACMFAVAAQVGTRRIRIFSFFPPEGRNAGQEEGHLAAAAERLARLAELAGREGLVLLLQNEKGIVGNTPERCEAIVRTVASPHLRVDWDPANFVQVGVERPTECDWPPAGSMPRVRAHQGRIAGRWSGAGGGRRGWAGA